MKCEHCGKNEATFFCRSNMNGRVTQVHLCQDCAVELGYTQQFVGSLRRRDFFDPFSLLSDFGMMPVHMLTEFPSPVEEALGEAPQREAPQPSLVSDEERQRLQAQRQRNALENQLSAALREENYEEAARLRDELKKLPKQD